MGQHVRCLKVTQTPSLGSAAMAPISVTDLYAEREPNVLRLVP